MTVIQHNKIYTITCFFCVYYSAAKCLGVKTETREAKIVIGFEIKGMDWTYTSSGDLSGSQDDQLTKAAGPERLQNYRTFRKESRIMLSTSSTSAL